tara:strand:+ start:1634 stop:1888 length:255 start_codon:yes stop_codon:yes gene_type:complete
MEETNSIKQETTEQPVDPQLQKRIAYTETLQQEIQSLQEQLANIQYQLDIRVTALVAYQSTLEVVEEPNQEKEDEVVEESLEQN